MLVIYQQIKDNFHESDFYSLIGVSVSLLEANRQIEVNTVPDLLYAQ